MNSGLPAQTDLLAHLTKHSLCDPQPPTKVGNQHSCPPPMLLGEGERVQGRKHINGGDTSRMQGVERDGETDMKGNGGWENGKGRDGRNI